MFDFEDTLSSEMDDLGDDFGIFNSPAFVRGKWRELRIQWDALISPYSTIGVGNIPVPNYVKTQFRIWQEALKNFIKDNEGFISGWTSSISNWRREAERYKKVYNYIQQLREVNARTPNANLALTPSPSESGAAPPLELSPDSTNNENGGSNSNIKLFDPSTWELNFGQVALLGLGTFVAYNVFFRLREGRRRI